MQPAVVPQITTWSFVEIIMLGIWCGLIALLFIEIMGLSERLFERLHWPFAVKALLGGALLVLVGYRSIYPSQLLGMNKNTSLKVETGKPIGEFEYAMIDHRITSLPGFVEKVMKRGRRGNKK